MKLRSGKLFSNDVSSVPTPKTSPNKSKLDLTKHTSTVKQIFKDFQCSSDSSESTLSDSSGETYSALPKRGAKKRLSKVVPLKKCNVRSASSSNKKHTQQPCISQASVHNEPLFSLSNQLKSLDIGTSENTANCPAETKPARKTAKHRSQLLKKSLCENSLPPKQCMPLYVGNKPAFAEDDNVEFPQDKLVNQTVKQVPTSCSETGANKLHGHVPCASKEPQEKTDDQTAPSKTLQPVLKNRRKLVGMSTAGTVKCATRVKTLVTKTLSGNNRKVVPVVYIESSSESESSVEADTKAEVVNCSNVGNIASGCQLKGGDDNKNGNNLMTNKPQEIFADDAVKNSTDKTEEVGCNIEAVKDLRTEACDIPMQKNILEVQKIIPSNTKCSQEPRLADNARERKQTENHESTSMGITSSAVYPKRSLEQVQVVGRTQQQGGYKYQPADQRSLPFYTRYWGTSQPRYQYHRYGNRSAWVGVHGDQGSRAHDPSTGPGSARNTELHARKLPQLSHDYDRLGSVLYRGAPTGPVQDRRAQQGPSPPAHVTGQRHNSATGLRNPVNVFGGNIYLPSSQPVRKHGLRPIIVDGSNVAMGHGGNSHFSYRGLQICVDYFVRRGHKVIAFLPQHRKCGLAAKDRLVLQQLEKGGHVVFTPSRRVDNRLVVPYDDWYIVQCAAVLEGVIVSNDNYRDLLSEDAQVARAIKERLLMYTWVENLLMFPKDPLGRGGPSLDQFLSFPAS